MTGAAAIRRRSSASDVLLTTGVRAVAIAVIAAGIFLRFWGLDQKLFSYDEATTSVRTAGYTLEDYYRASFDGRIVKNSAFLTFQHAGLAGRPAADAVRSLALEDPQHPPLYYLLERASAALGDSVADRRIVSAIAGTLLLGAAVWLGIELFGSAEAGLIAGALMAVSPFFVIYSQQAREYTVWGLCIAVSCAVLIRAMRTGGTGAWLWYALSVALGLYSDLIFAYVLAGQGAYALALSAHMRLPRRFLAFAAAAVAGLAAFAPWLVAVYRGRDLLTNNDYLGVPLPVTMFGLKWAFNTGAVFFDLDYEKVALGALLLPIFALIAYAFVALARHAPPEARLLVFTLAATTALAFVVPDFVRHESRSTVARYLLPTWLAIEVAVAYLFARWLQPANAVTRRAAAALGLVALLACGLLSDAVDARSQTTWAEGKSIAGLGPIARILNAAPQPTLVFIADPQRFDFASLALSNELRGDVGVRQLRFGINDGLLRSTPHPYVIDPTPRVRASLARSGIVLRPVYEDADTSPDAIRNLRAQATAIRRSKGEDVGALSLWTVARE